MRANPLLMTAALAASLVLAGCGNTSGPTKSEEEKMYQDAQKKYSDMGVGNGTDAPASTPAAGSRPGLSGEMEARQKMGAKGGN